MKKLLEVVNLGKGVLKKYLFHYTVDGKPFTYEVVSRNEIPHNEILLEKADAVTVISVSEDGKIIDTTELKYHINDYCWMLPMGSNGLVKAPLQTEGDTYLKRYLYHYTVDGKPFVYEVVSRNAILNKNELPERTNAVTVIGFTEDNRLIVTKEFRYAVNDYVWEFPAGLIDEGETIQEAAIREMKEETGLDVVDIIMELPGGYSSAGMTDEKVAVIVCKVDGTIKESKGIEEIYVHKMTVAEAQTLISDGSLKVSGRLQLFIAGLGFQKKLGAPMDTGETDVLPKK